MLSGALVVEGRPTIYVKFCVQALPWFGIHPHPVYVSAWVTVAVLGIRDSAVGRLEPKNLQHVELKICLYHEQ